MTNIEWETSKPKREYCYMLLCSLVVAIVFSILVVPRFGMNLNVMGIGTFLSIWGAFSVYRSRPKKIVLYSQTLTFNNLGTYDLSNLKSVREKIIFGFEKVLELQAQKGKATMSLHGVPDCFKKNLVGALVERISQ